MAIKIYQLPDQVKGLLATLGCASTVNGNRCSDYFIIAEDEEIGNDLSVSLIEERANLPQREWGYSMHVINDIKDTFCQIYHDDGNPGTPEEIALAMLKKIIAAELGIFSIPARLPTCKEWDALVDAVGESDDMLHWQNIFFWCQDGIPDCIIITRRFGVRIRDARPAWDFAPFSRVRLSICFPRGMWQQSGPSIWTEPPSVCPRIPSGMATFATTSPAPNWNSGPLWRTPLTRFKLSRLATC